MARLRRVVCAAYYPRREQVGPQPPPPFLRAPPGRPPSPHPVPAAPGTRRLPPQRHPGAAAGAGPRPAPSRHAARGRRQAGRPRPPLPHHQVSSQPGPHRRLAKGRWHPRRGSVTRVALPRGALVVSLPAGCQYLPAWLGFWASRRNTAWLAGRRSARTSSPASPPAAKVGADPPATPNLGPSPPRENLPRLRYPQGLYCRECFQTLSNICTVCMGPLTFQDTGDEEM